MKSREFAQSIGDDGHSWQTSVERLHIEEMHEVFKDAVRHMSRVATQILIRYIENDFRRFHATLGNHQLRDVPQEGVLRRVVTFKGCHGGAGDGAAPKLYKKTGLQLQRV